MTETYRTVGGELASKPLAVPAAIFRRPNWLPLVLIAGDALIAGASVILAYEYRYHLDRIPQVVGQPLAFGPYVAANPVVIAKEQRRADALEQIQELRDRGYRVDYPLTADKIAKQFQTAENVGARIALLYGDEWPQVKVKNLATREESLIPHDALLDSVAKFFTVSGSA